MAIKHPDSALMLLANGRLVEHSGKDIKDQKVMSLIGKAIELKLVPITQGDGIILATSDKKIKIKSNQ